MTIASALTTRGEIAAHGGDYERTRSCFEEALGICRSFGRTSAAAARLHVR